MTPTATTTARNKNRIVFKKKSDFAGRAVCI